MATVSNLTPYRPSQTELDMRDLDEQLMAGELSQEAYEDAIAPLVAKFWEEYETNEETNS